MRSLTALVLALAATPAAAHHEVAVAASSLPLAIGVFTIAVASLAALRERAARRRKTRRRKVKES